MRPSRMSAIAIPSTLPCYYGRAVFAEQGQGTGEASCIALLVPSLHKTKLYATLEASEGARSLLFASIDIHLSCKLLLSSCRPALMCPAQTVQPEAGNQGPTKQDLCNLELGSARFAFGERSPELSLLFEPSFSFSAPMPIYACGGTFNARIWRTCAVPGRVTSIGLEMPLYQAGLGASVSKLLFYLAPSASTFPGSHPWSSNLTPPRLLVFEAGFSILNQDFPQTCKFERGRGMCLLSWPD